MNAADIARALGASKAEGDGWRATCPAHDDRTPSLSVSDDRVNGRVLVHCHAGCPQSKVIEALKARKLWPRPIIEATYDYCDESGKLLYQVVRYANPKAFRQRRPDGSGGWIWGRGKVPHVPYNLDVLLKNPDETVLVVEGEKDVLNLIKLGFVATCNDSGAGKFSNDLSTYFYMRRVVLIPDNDEAGRQHVDDVASKLRSVAEEIRFLELPDLPPKGDVSDWLAAGGTTEEMQALIESAPPRQARKQQEQQDGDGADPDDTIAERRDRLWLEVHESDLPRTAAEVVKILSGAPRLFERGEKPVKLVDTNGVATAEPLTSNNIVMEVHALVQPYRLKIVDDKLVKVPETLPDRVARMYLDKKREWGLRPLAGIASTPLLDNDGSIRVSQGYDAQAEVWCHAVPEVNIPERPTREEAQDSLNILRWWFRSFPFADSETCADADRIFTTRVVDLSKPPGANESAFLAMLLTAVVRPSLRLAPGFVQNAPARSGSGTGKGVLLRCTSMVATGRPPLTTTFGHSDEEFDKRLVSMVLTAAQVLFFDNFNTRDLKSDTLASILTERPSHVRILGKSEMVEINSAAFVALSGNGLRITEDLLRRFVQVLFDAHMEDPASRRFDFDIVEETLKNRRTLLECALTIWRWGRQNEAQIAKGIPLGGFETWARWCRDPLVALGCRDPVAAISDMRAADPERNRLLAFLGAWHSIHGDEPIHLSDIERSVRLVLDPDDKMTRQKFEAFVSQHTDSVIGDCVLRRASPEKRRKDGRPGGRQVMRYFVTKSEIDK